MVKIKKWQNLRAYNKVWRFKKSLYFIFILQILQKNNENVKILVNPCGCIYIYIYVLYISFIDSTTEFYIINSEKISRF